MTSLTVYIYPVVVGVLLSISGDVTADSSLTKIPHLWPHKRDCVARSLTYHEDP